MKLQVIGSSPAWPNPGGARTGLLVSGIGPAAIGLACLLYLNHTLEGRITYARVQS